MQRLSHLIEKPLARFPDRLAARGSDGDFTFAALDRSAARVAGSLSARGLHGDEPVPVRISNRVLDIAGLLGVWRAGGVAVPLHRATPERSARALIERSGARFIVDAAEALALEPGGVPPPERALLKDAALIIFTSGTTGEPKGVVLTHRAFAAKLASINRVFPFREATRTLLALQLTFSFGQWVSLLTLSQGGFLLLHEKFEATGALAALAGERLDRIGIVPTMMRAALPLLETAMCGRDGIRRLFMAGGEPMAATLSRAWRAALPEAELADIYGLTETGTCDFCLPPDEQEIHPGTIGTPMPEVGFAIEEGELQIKTPFVMAGYLDAPELTKAAFRGDFFRTGDLAELTPAGRVKLVGRAKEVILRGGNKVSPLEVERTFLDHPDVAQALATGVEDPHFGESIHLLIVPKPQRTPSAAELRDWARERLDRYKLPDAIHFGAELPLGRTGKADRAALRAKLSGGKG